LLLDVEDDLNCIDPRVKLVVGIYRNFSDVDSNGLRPLHNTDNIIFNLGGSKPLQTPNPFEQATPKHPMARLHRPLQRHAHCVLDT
jgi:hypothetical protein